MKRKHETPPSRPTFGNSSSSTLMEMIKNQKERRKKIKQEENNSSFIVESLHGIYSDHRKISTSLESHDHVIYRIFDQTTISLLSDLSKDMHSLEIFRERIEKYIIHSYQYLNDTNLINQFIVYHIYLSQEIFLCFLKSKSEAGIRERLVEIGSRSILSFDNTDRNVMEYYFIRLFKFLNCEYMSSISDRNKWIYMLSSADFLKFTSKGIQKLFNVTSEGSLTLHSTTLSLFQEAQIISIPKFLMTCSDIYIDNMVERMLFENHAFESNPIVMQHFENVSYHCIWFITFNDKKRDTSKLLRFISNFRKVNQFGNSKPLMIWGNLTTNNSSNPNQFKSYMILLKSSKKIIDRTLFHSFVLNEFYNLFQIPETLSTEDLFQMNKEPFYLTVDSESNKVQDDVFQWIMDNFENFNGTMSEMLKEMFLFPNLNFKSITNFGNKLLKHHENTILKLLDELILDCINREDVPGCINCLIIGRNIYPIPKSMRPKNSISSGNQHLSTIDQWMKDNLFIYLSSGGINTGIERNTRQASFVTKLMEHIVPIENTLFLTIYQKILNNLVNSRHELVSVLLTKIKKTLQQSETQNNQDSSEDSDYEEVKTILLEYEKFGENAYNVSSKSSILPLTYYPVMKKTRWCNAIVPQLISFTLRDCNDGIMKTKFEKLKSALISSLVNRKLIPKDIIQSEPKKDDNQAMENVSSTLHLKVSLVEGCLLRVVSEIENQIKKQSTNIDSLLALFFECHTAITDIVNLMKLESVYNNIRLSTQKKLMEIVLQSFYECCMVMGSFSQHEGLLVTIMSDSQTSDSLPSSQRKQIHLDWIVLFKVSVLMPLSNVSNLLKDRVLALLRNISTKEPNSDLIFTISVLISSLITVSTNEITIIQEFIELTNKGKEKSAHNMLEQVLEERMALIMACFGVWDEIKPKNFMEAILFSKLIISCFEVCHHLQNYNSDFGESSNTINCISHNILEETFRRSVITHFTSSQNNRGNEFFCFVPSKMQTIHFWITTRYSLLFSHVDLSSRKNEKVQQVLNFTKQDDSKIGQVKNQLSCIQSSFRNNFIENLFSGIELPDFEEWIGFELCIHDEVCHNTLFLYYKSQLLQYNTLLSSKQSQNSLPYMLSTFFSKALSLHKPYEHHSIMIHALVGLIPKFTTSDQFSKQDQFWLFKSWIPAMQSIRTNARKCLYDFVSFTDHVDPIIYFMGTYSQSRFSQDFDSNLRILFNTLSDFSTTCLEPISHLHPWPVLFTSKILEGLFSLIVISLTWPLKRESNMKDLKRIFNNFITQNLIFKLNIIRNLSFHVSNIETWIFNYFSNTQSNKEALLYKSKEMLKDIISDLEKDYNFGMKFLDESPSTLLCEILGKTDAKFGGLLISDMLISLFIKPKASKYLDSFFELKEKSMNEEFQPSKITIHSQSILEYLDETESLKDTPTDTSRLSQTIELVFGRINSLLNTNQELWLEFFHHLLTSLVIHYISFVNQLENSNTSIPDSPLKNVNQDIPRILETLIHQILASNPVNFVSIAGQAFGGNISGIQHFQDENTDQAQAEYQWLITISLIQIILANDEIIYCILNPQNTNSSWSDLTSNSEFQSILSRLLDNVGSMALCNEINVNSKRVKIDRISPTALNMARKLIQKQLLTEHSIESIN